MPYKGKCIIEKTSSEWGGFFIGGIMKYYAVRVGRTPGIYHTWDECKREVEGFKGAQYKKFESEKEALAFMEGKKEFVPKAYPKEDEVFAYVDGSFNVQDFSYSYGMVLITTDGEETFKKAYPKDEFSSMRNVQGEIMGAMEAIKKAYEAGKKRIVIYYDYEGIEKWATGEWKRNKEGTILYKEFIDEYKSKIEIKFVKVLAHSGDKYNEMADELAKSALGIKK